MSVDLTTRIGSLVMKNPVTTASGTFAAGRQYNDFFDISKLGAVTTKGVSLGPWDGNDSPRIAETPSGMLNSIGLQNPGVEAFCEGDLAWLSTRGVPIIVNVSGHSFGEYAAVIERLEEEPAVSAYEINISCPNVSEGGMTFGIDPAASAKVIASCRAATKRPLIAKLTPNVTDITKIAKVVQDEGADAVSLINTVLGMAIDAKKRKPVLARKVGGLSGPAVKPIALRMVYEVHQAVQIPIVGMGGITCGTDAVEFMLAGATAVAVGTASFMNPRASLEVVEGIERYCEENEFEKVSDLVGALE
ncbi:MAG: dihydroorotate dehydrogenase [Coriobacteriales bacterium]|jgi:dihydroorotate dehydrogenase (NAD+) catalytic subunit